MIIASSKDLYQALTIERNKIDKAVCSDVNSMRLYFEGVIDLFAWLLGYLNPAEFCNKLKSLLADTSLFTLAFDIPQTDLFGCDLNHCEMAYGCPPETGIVCNWYCFPVWLPVFYLFLRFTQELVSPIDCVSAIYGELNWYPCRLWSIDMNYIHVFHMVFDCLPLTWLALA